jgi:hypothetical protein
MLFSFVSLLVFLWIFPIVPMSIAWIFSWTFIAFIKLWIFGLPFVVVVSIFLYKH